MLVVFLTDPSMRPGLAQTRASQAKNRVLARLFPAGGKYLGYLDVATWLLVAILLRPARWGWIIFLLAGRECAGARPSRAFSRPPATEAAATAAAAAAPTGPATEAEMVL